MKQYKLGIGILIHLSMLIWQYMSLIKVSKELVITDKNVLEFTQW